MKRITIAAAAFFIAAATFAAWGTAAPGGKVAALAGPAAKPKPAKPKLPALPSDVKKRKKWLIGVKCDFSPFGFIDARGNNEGYDVQVARRFASLAFGNKKKVNFTCVTTPSRIPTLISGRDDMRCHLRHVDVELLQELDASPGRLAGSRRRSSEGRPCRHIHVRRCVSARRRDAGS